MAPLASAVSSRTGFICARQSQACLTLNQLPHSRLDLATKMDLSSFGRLSIISLMLLNLCTRGAAKQACSVCTISHCNPCCTACSSLHSRHAVLKLCLDLQSTKPKKGVWLLSFYVDDCIFNVYLRHGFCRMFLIHTSTVSDCNTH